VLVPFVFVFSPSLLLVSKGFSASEFAVTFGGCVLGITILGAAFSRWFLVEMTTFEQALCGVAAVLMVAPGLPSTLVGVLLVQPMVWRHVLAWRASRRPLVPSP
jgi:TRAP-type uncharacterized transport system fused permease subunit